MTSSPPDILTSGAVTSSPPDILTPGAVRVQQGRVKCIDSSNWPRDTSYGVATTIYHKFDTPYPSTPYVHITVHSVDIEQGSNVRYDVSVTSSDRNGFSVKCKTWGVGDDLNYMTHVWHLFVDFTSIL